MLTLGLITVALSLFYYFFIRPMSYWKKRGVLQTSPIWFFGDMFRTALKLVTFPEWINDLYRTFPDTRYFGWYHFSRPTLLIRDPDLIKQITVKAFDHFGDHRFFVSEKADPLFANNLFALRGQRWREMRPTLSPFFTSSKMKQMFVLMSECAEKFIDFFLEKNQDIVEVELKNYYTRFCNDIIGTAAFGIETDSLRNPDNEFYKMGKEATNFSGLWKSVRLFIIQLSPKLSEILKLTIFGKDLSRFFYDLVDETIRVREEKNIVRPDVIHLLMQVKKGTLRNDNENEVEETGFSTATEVLKGKVSHRPITNQEIASQALVFFFGGFESVSTLMCFITYELAVNPDIQRRLRAEVEETFADCNGKLTYDAINKMKYMDMVVSESLRKWPNSQTLNRECTKPYTIEPSGPGEMPLHLVPGDMVWIPVYALHHDEKYFPDPEKFNPERFSDENKGNINPLTYIPFGSGPRNCIGSRFALLENKAVIFHLLRHFEIVPTKKSQIPLVIGKNAFQLASRDGFWFGLKKLHS